MKKKMRYDKSRDVKGERGRWEGGEGARSEAVAVAEEIS